MIELIYVDDVLLFGTDQDNIDEVIKELEDAGISLTVEEDVYDFLGVEVKTDNQSGKVTLTGGGLTKKVLKIVGILDSNDNTTPSETMPLGTYADGPTFDEHWEYDSVVGTLMYLSRKFRPDIQFVVHYCSRLTHNLMKIHSEAVNMICHYLFGTQSK